MHTGAGRCAGKQRPHHPSRAGAFLLLKRSVPLSIRMGIIMNCFSLSFSTSTSSSSSSSSPSAAASSSSSNPECSRLIRLVCKPHYTRSLVGLLQSLSPQRALYSLVKSSHRYIYDCKHVDSFSLVLLLLLNFSGNTYITAFKMFSLFPYSLSSPLFLSLFLLAMVWSLVPAPSG